MRHVEEENFKEELAIPSSGEKSLKRQVKELSKIIKLDPLPVVCQREDSQWTLPAASKASTYFAKVSPHLPLIVRQNHHVSGHSGVEHVHGARTAVRRYL